jgi:phage/conjugal plasmid C-4 type zinc finger TraR family protein
MSDDVDVAQQIEAENLAVILANRPRTTTGVSAIDCAECDKPIPQARRLALPGIQTCVYCAQLNEDKTAFQRGRFR